MGPKNLKTQLIRELLVLFNTYPQNMKMPNKGKSNTSIFIYQRKKPWPVTPKERAIIMINVLMEMHNILTKMAINILNILAKV